MPNIVLCYPVTSKHIDWINRVVPDNWEVIDAGQDGIAEAILDADIFCGHAKVPVPWSDVVARGRLQWIQSSAAGLDHCLTPDVITSDIRVTSASGVFANQVAEQTLALVFGLFRQLPLFFRLAQDRIFERHPTWDVHGKSIGIVGLGGNGRRIAELLRPLGNRILATDWFVDDCPETIDELYPHEELLKLLAQVDIVILCVPLNRQTFHLMDQEAFAAMKDGAVLINVARGAVIDEPALVEALDSGHLAGAAVDVTEVEPLHAESPLWSRDNVLITPHVGAQAACRVDDSTKLFCVNLARQLEGESLLNEVQKDLGFPRPSCRVSVQDVRKAWESLERSGS